MASENYLFEFGGAKFNVTADHTNGATTTESPNMRVIEGAWKTWRLVVDPDTPGIAGLRLFPCVDPANPSAEHPSGNGSGASRGDMLMATRHGTLYTIPGGYGAISRLYSREEWQAQLNAWEASL